MAFSEAEHNSRIKLTAEEMLEISQEISRKFAPNASTITPDPVDLSFDHHDSHAYPQSGKKTASTAPHSGFNSQIGFSEQELFDISREISQQFAPTASTSVPELFLLPVDPSHLYAYWNLGETRIDTAPKDDSGNPLILRIYWRPDENAEITRTKVWFDIPVDRLQTRKKVQLPLDDSAYSATLGKFNPDHGFAEYAHSNIVRVPPGRIRRTPFLRHDGDTKSETFRENPAHTAAALYVEDSSLDSKFADQSNEKQRADTFFAESAWSATLRVGGRTIHWSGNASSYAKLIDALNEKDPHLRPDFVGPSSPSRSKTASGQGI